MECLIVCNEYPFCFCGFQVENDPDEEFLDPEEFDDWFTEEE